MNTANHSDIADLSRVQRRRKRVLFALALLIAAALPFTASVQGPEGMVHETVEAIGFILIVLCVLGRSWATLYIGGNKKRALIADGPYSLVRNPLYVFSVIGTIGIGLTTGSVAFGATFGLAAFLVFDGVIRREEAFLRENFGMPYHDYATRVLRWRPRLAGWHDAHEVVVQPRLVLTTFRDASLFLLAVPLTEWIDHLQAAGFLPVLLRLP